MVVAVKLLVLVLAKRVADITQLLRHTVLYTIVSFNSRIWFLFGVVEQDRIECAT